MILYSVSPCLSGPAHRIEMRDKEIYERMAFIKMLQDPAPPSPKSVDFEKQFYSMMANHDDMKLLRFMNYGFVPDNESERLTLDDSDEMFRTQIHLYDYLARQVKLEGRNVLEVGCGRAGGASYVAGRFSPKTYTGVDVAKGSIRQGTRNNRHSNLSLLVGCAESLPFREGSFDVILNVESCHRYSPIESFLAGARRVLVPDGYLVLTDFRDLIGVDYLRRALAASGLVMLDEKNITRNVFEALRRDSRWRMEAIMSFAPEEMWPSLREYGAAQGSWLYRAFENGDAKYMSYVLQKR